MNNEWKKKSGLNNRIIMTWTYSIVKTLNLINIYIVHFVTHKLTGRVPPLGPVLLEFNPKQDYTAHNPHLSHPVTLTQLYIYSIVMVWMVRYSIHGVARYLCRGGKKTQLCRVLTCMYHTMVCWLIEGLLLSVWEWLIEYWEKSRYELSHVICIYCIHHTIRFAQQQQSTTTAVAVDDDAAWRILFLPLPLPLSLSVVLTWLLQVFCFDSWVDS